MKLKIFLDKWKENTSISREYFIFAAIVVSASIIASLVLGKAIYTSYLHKIRHTSSVDASRIESTLKNVFDETNKMMVYVGKQIAKTNGELKAIEVLLRSTTGAEYKSTSLFSWSNFDWVAPNNLQLVNSRNGIAKNPPDMSMREYTWKSPEKPWTLQVSKPAIGNPSKMWVIPAGTGVTDLQGNYLGTVVVGFNVTELTNKIEEVIRGNNTSFILLDKNYNIVSYSADHLLNRESDYYKALIKDGDFLNKEGDLDQEITYGDIIYYHYLKMDDYPYIILTGMNKNVMNQQFYSILLPRVLEFFLVAVFGVVLLFIFRQKIIKPITELSGKAVEISKGNTDVIIPNQRSKEMFHLAKGLLKVKGYIRRINHLTHQLEESHQQLQLKNLELENLAERLEHSANLVKASDEAKEEFSRRIRQEVDTPIDTIVYTVDVLVKALKGEINVAIPKDQQIHLMEQVIESAIEVRTLTTRILDIQPLELNSLIESCVTIHMKEAMAKHTELKAEIAADLPVFYADDLRMRQIIVGLLARAIEYTPQGLIELSAHMFEQDEKRFLKIVVKDNGFGLSEEEIKRLHHRYGKSTISRNIDGMELELPSIEKLIRMHKGICKIDSQHTKGTTVTLEFPYLQPEDFLASEEKAEKELGAETGDTNVVKLFTEK